MICSITIVNNTTESIDYTETSPYDPTYGTLWPKKTSFHNFDTPNDDGPYKFIFRIKGTETVLTNATIPADTFAATITLAETGGNYSASVTL